MSEKKPLTSLFRENPNTPEGKYLVMRRDGTIPKWPSFVLGGADPIAAVAMRAYASEVGRLLRLEPVVAEHLGLTPDFQLSLIKWADEFDRYRTEEGEGDPGMGPHRKDDPAIIELMKKGRSA